MQKIGAKLSFEKKVASVNYSYCYKIHIESKRGFETLVIPQKHGLLYTSEQNIVRKLIYRFKKNSYRQKFEMLSKFKEHSQQTVEKKSELKETK